MKLQCPGSWTQLLYWPLKPGLCAGEPPAQLLLSWSLNTASKLYLWESAHLQGGKIMLRISMWPQFYPSRKKWGGSTGPAFLFFTQWVLKKLYQEREPRVRSTRHVGLAEQLGHELLLSATWPPAQSLPCLCRWRSCFSQDIWKLSLDPKFCLKRKSEAVWEHGLGNHEIPLWVLENCSLVNVLPCKGKSLKDCSGLLEPSLQWKQIASENTMPCCF